MPTWLFILVSVCVAAFVGGLTNHFAIKMLFHPRQAWHIGRWRVPFTPGLIPKRKEEIARSLGEVVAEYLVTTEGLQQLVSKPEFRGKIEQNLRERLASWASDERTVKEIASAYWSEEEWENFKSKLARVLMETANGSVRRLWDRYGMQDKPLKELVPGWSADMKVRFAELAVETIVATVAEELTSAQGQRTLRKLAASLIDKAGGFLGAMAAIFVDEDKLVHKLTPVIVEQLRSNALRGTIRGMIERKLDEIAELPLGQAIQTATGEEAWPWVSDKLRAVLQWRQWMGRFESARLCDLIGRHETRLAESLPPLIRSGLKAIERVLPHIVQAIQLPRLVQEQVEQFPVERLEKIILSVSGREFRAITWLGALLGGMIGLVQSALMLWMGM